LLVTAFVIAPLAATVQGLSWSAFWSDPNGPLDYVWRNSLLWIQQTAISSTPAGVPLPYEWNASLWTLYWEFLCYLLLLVLGVWGVLRRTPYVVIWLTGLLWLVFVVRAFHDDFDTWVNTSFTALVLGFPTHRCATAGLPCAVVRGASTNPMGVASRPVLRLYIYAFPMQQMLVIAGVSFGWITSAVLAVLMTLPLAAFSWFVVERPMLRRKNWTLRHAASALPR
jgi:peptidoglycan/LPS O-acetylase OafA/YrhL